MNEWIKATDQMPPKESKFLFHYYFGIGIGDWSRIYHFQDGGHSYLSDEYRYCLVLWASEHKKGMEEKAMQWDEEKLIEMKISWMPLPKPPEEDE